MNSNKKLLHFFLGANTPQGFVSRFDQLADASDGWRAFILKGGPGTGKSTLMKRMISQVEDRCPQIEMIHCSSDVDSLDGVIIPAIKTSIADGTAPHVIEPKYPGAFEQLVDLSGCWDEHLLYERRKEIMTLAARISRCHEHCCRFLAAAGSLLSDNWRIALDATEITKLQKAAARIASAEFKDGGNAPGHESVRFLSAVTNKGPVLFHETANALCSRIYLIEDSYGASSRLILNALRSRALESGLDIISCYCPLSPFEKLEHLFIPSLQLGFMTSNDFHHPDVVPYKVIRSRRFTDEETLKKSRRRLTFNRKAAQQLLNEAAFLLAEAYELHNQLETYYIAAMDFSAVDSVISRLLEKYEHILSKYPL